MTVRIRPLLLLPIVVLVTVLSSVAQAHHSRVSLTEIEWNARSQRFEVAMRLRIPDLQDAISAMQKERIRLTSDPAHEQYLRRYLQHQFAVCFARDRACRLHWVGCEFELHDVWIYFEAESCSPKSASAETDPLNQSVDNQPQSENPPADWDDLLRSSSASVDRTESVGVSIFNRCLMELYPDQVNVIVLKCAGQTNSMQLTIEEPAATIRHEPTTQHHRRAPLR